MALKSKVKAFVQWMDRKAPYFEVWAAVIVLFSWVISSTLSKAADDRKKEAQSIRSDSAAALQRLALGEKLRKVEFLLIRVNANSPQNDDGSSKHKKKLADYFSVLSSMKELGSGVVELQEQVKQTQGRVQGFDPELDKKLDTLTDSIKSYDAKFKNAFESVLQEMDPKGAKTDEDAQSRFDMARKMDNKQLTPLFRDLESLLTETRTLLLEVGDEYRADQQRWQVYAAVSNWLALALSFFGSAVAIIGKYRVENSKSKTESPGEAGA